MKDRIVTFGGTGLVGQGLLEFEQLAGSNNFDILSSQDADITNKRQVEEVLAAAESNNILLLAAYTNVDGAQTDLHNVLNINVKGVRNVTDMADKLGKRVLYVSSDMVFSGGIDRPGPYSEDMLTDPNAYKRKEIGVYAYTKQIAEEIVFNSSRQHAVIRISFPFGSPSGEGDLISKALKMIDKGYALFDDQTITPTYIPDLWHAVHRIIETEGQGMFHVATTPPTTLYEFASYIAVKAKLDTQIKRGSFDSLYSHEARTLSAEAGRVVSPRPKMGGLLTNRSQQLLGITFHTWKEAVDDYFDRIYKQ